MKSGSGSFIVIEVCFKNLFKKKEPCSRQNYSSTGLFLGKLYFIPDGQNYPRLNCLKTITFTATHIYIAYMGVPPPPLEQ